MKCFQFKNAALRAAFFVGILFLPCSLLAIAGCSNAPKLNDGDKAPNFEFVLPDGTKTDLTATLTNKGANQNSLLVLWSTWCDVCKKELPELDNLASKSGINVVAVAIRDQKERWKNYISENKYPNLIIGFADTKAVLDKYKGDGVPEAFLIDSSGNLKSVVDVSGQSVVRMIGPQMWSQSEFIKQFY